MLARFTLRAKGIGLSPIAIGYDPQGELYPLTMDTRNEIVIADKMGSASVAVGQDCPPEAVPPIIVDTPNTEEELFGGTPPPDAAAAGGDTDSRAATDGQTPGADGQTDEGQPAEGEDGAPAERDGVPCQPNNAPTSETPAATTAGTGTGDELCTLTPSPLQQALADASGGSNTGLFGGAVALLGLSTAAAGGGWYVFRRSRNGAS